MKEKTIQWIVIIIIGIISLIGIRGGVDGIPGIPGKDGKIGAFPGPDIFQHVFLNEGATFGGTVSTTTGVSQTTHTSVRIDFGKEPTVYEFNPGVQIAYAWSATSTHGYVPRVGDVSTIYFRNASTTATDASITFSAVDSGVDIQENEGGNLVLDGQDWAKITFIRSAVNIVTIIIAEMQEG